MRSCTPTPSAPTATGRQSGESQKTQACPKAGPNRSRHRYADPRTATLHPRCKVATKRLFLFHRARRILFLGKTKKRMGGASPVETAPWREPDLVTPAGQTNRPQPPLRGPGPMQWQIYFFPCSAFMRFS